MTIIAIDPGTEQSGWCAYGFGEVLTSGVMPNAEMLTYLQRDHMRISGHHLAIEMIASYGMPVGRETFETCLWIGRFVQAWYAPDAVQLVYRKDVKLHLCGSPRAKDANIRQAILDIYGGKDKAIGKKAAPGPLYGVKSHAWPALAVAITACAPSARIQ